MSKEHTPPAQATEAPPIVAKPLLATRFKLSFNKAGNCTTFRRDQAEELEGQWVWLIDASNGMNDPLYTSPYHAATPSHPMKEED